jgi:hypothetical protein
MGSGGSKSGDTERAPRVTGRAVGITGGGPLRRATSARIPANAIRSKAEDHEFIEVGLESSSFSSSFSSSSSSQVEAAAAPLAGTSSVTSAAAGAAQAVAEAGWAHQQQV